MESPSKAWVIRRAVPADYAPAARLIDLDLDAHRQARPDYFRTPGCGYEPAEFLELLAKPCPICWVAAGDGDLWGLCFGVIQDTKESGLCRSRRIALVQDLVTLPAYRGRGIASALMDRAKAQAAAAGAVSLELCVWGFNAGARRLYEKLGLTVQYSRMETALTTDPQRTAR